ncbi:MAG: TIM barrel protein, partial [Alphaproteobacteria bacterium]
AEFRDAVALARRYADKLRPANVNVLAGVPSETRDRAECAAVMAENLAFAAETFAEIGVGVVVEAINDTDWPGFFLTTPEKVFEVIDLAGHANLSMEFDIYHMRMMTLPVVETFEKHVARIGHIQFADAPGRHEPGTGDIDFGAIFAAIYASVYDGWLAAEYLPAGRTEDGLGWIEKYS